jgi:hypothetical protein
VNGTKIKVKKLSFPLKRNFQIKVMIAYFINFFYFLQLLVTVKFLGSAAEFMFVTDRLLLLFLLLFDRKNSQKIGITALRLHTIIFNRSFSSLCFARI